MALGNTRIAVATTLIGLQWTRKRPQWTGIACNARVHVRNRPVRVCDVDETARIEAIVAELDR